MLPPAAEVPPAGTDWRLVDFWYDRMTEALVTAPDETLTRLADAVVAWHELLVELATDADGRFAAKAAPAAADGTDEPPAWRAVQSNGRITIYALPQDRRLPRRTCRPNLSIGTDGGQWVDAGRSARATSAVARLAPGAASPTQSPRRKQLGGEPPRAVVESVAEDLARQVTVGHT